MVNLFFKKLFGQLPATEKYVKQNEMLRKEMNEFDAFAKGEKLNRYYELEKIVQSKEHYDTKKKLQELKYDGSEEHKNELEFKNLCKNKELKLFFKVKDGEALSRFKRIEDSDFLAKYTEMESLINSKGIEKDKEQIKAFKELKRNEDIKFYNKYKNSKEYKTYQKALNGSALNRYNELKSYINSDEFKDRKEYLLDPKKFEKSEGYRNEQEIKELKSDKEINWYFKLLKSNKFDATREWNPIFEDTFEGFDDSKWIPIPFQGMLNLQGRSYVPEGNLQFHTDGKNLKFEDGCINIETRKENVRGLRWQVSSGFKMRDFEYTSGMINTGHSFRFQEGKIEVLARMTSSKEVIHAMFLRSETITPHIEVFCSGSKKGLKVRLFYKNKNKPDFEETITGINLASNFLYSLEWGHNFLRWQINGYTVAEYSGILPRHPLYLGLSSVLLEKTENLPANLIVDTIRVYEKQK